MFDGLSCLAREGNFALAGQAKGLSRRDVVVADGFLSIASWVFACASFCEKVVSIGIEG
jgi:hypothetical protein